MRFNIIYFAFVSERFGGVEQKVISQYDALINYNRDTHLYLISSFSPDEQLRLEIEKRLNVHIIINSLKGLKNPISRRIEKFFLIESVINKFDPGNTIVYFRYPNADIVFLNFLKRIHNFALVTEHQEIENTFYKYRFNGNYLRNICEVFWGRSVRQRLGGFVGVTPEITEYEVKISGNPLKPSTTIGNGAKVEIYPLRILNKDNPEIIKLLFVGAGYKTHGLFRLLKSIYLYNNRNRKNFIIYLKIVGDSPEMITNKKLVKQLHLYESVEFHGELNQAALNEFYNWADLGVGSLGLHRIGLSCSSTLKVREYLSRGIPFIWSNIDTDLPRGFEYVLQLESNDNSFSLEEVIDFVHKTRKDYEHPQKMNTYAKKYLDWSVKMPKLIDFLSLILEQKKKLISS